VVTSNEPRFCTVRDGTDELRFAIEDLDPLVGEVANEDVVRSIDSDSAWASELSVALASLSKRPHECTIRTELLKKERRLVSLCHRFLQPCFNPDYLNSVVVAISDVDVSL